MKKVCTRCKVKKEFPLEFNKRNNYNPKSTKQYYKGHCKMCDVKLAVKWNKENKDRYNAYQKSYQRQRSESHKKLGLCISCKQKATKGKVSCERHLEIERKKWHKYAEKKKSPIV